MPATQETWVWSLGQEDPLEEGMAAHSSILAWRIPRTEELGGLQPMGSQRASRVWATNTDWLTEAGNVFVPQINFALLTSETLLENPTVEKRDPVKLRSWTYRVLLLKCACPDTVLRLVQLFIILSRCPWAFTVLTSLLVPQLPHSVFSNDCCYETVSMTETTTVVF